MDTTRAFFGVSNSQLFYRPEDHKHRRFEMHNNTPAAFFVTVQVCTMASAYSSNPTFLLVEPKNQLHAHKRPDAGIWRDAENKELDMLFGSTFEMTDRSDYYDQPQAASAICIQAQGDK